MFLQISITLLDIEFKKRFHAMVVKFRLSDLLSFALMDVFILDLFLLL